ncbi:MAG: (Fe-S)-binding protein [Candidatus Aramenus sp.]|jgi:glycolate oxidase iron-sulfur subunit|nr:(Fe-S)-binding protein [Candidatus Aramenus sp.]
MGVGLELDKLELDKCVHCGFCLEVCPTYVITGSEVHSPRGRIWAVRLGVKSEGLETCVFCRRCEAACPSGVEYGKAISSYRRADATKKLVHKVLETPGLLYASLKVYSRSSSPIALRIKEFVKSYQPPLQHKDENAELLLFPGCLNSVVYRGTVEKALNYLRRFYKVEVYNSCCGLPHYAEGEKERALKIAEKLKEAFKGKVVVSLSSNCTAHMREMGLKVFDFAEFVVKNNLPLSQREITVTVHDPCHASLVGLNKYTREMLKRMGAKIVEMEDPSFECGAGGTYFIFNPELSQKIVEEKGRKVKATGVENVISTNQSCSLALSLHGKVLHVADLL